MSEQQTVVVIPVYNHAHAIVGLVERIAVHGLPCLLVDDGSGAECATVLDQLAAQRESVNLVRLSPNQGKGAAVMAGMREAGRLGYSHVLQIDADGQHDSDDIPGFLADSKRWPADVIGGSPIYDESVPKGRLYGRYLTHVWVWINTLSLQIKDSMCGFRVYPLEATLALLDRANLGKRMDFDVEILVRLHWAGVRVRDRPTRVIYPEDGVSHFQVWRDNARISKMHTKLFFGMLLRSPTLLLRKFRSA